MFPDRQKVWTDGRNGRTDGQRKNYIPPTLSGDNKLQQNLLSGSLLIRTVSFDSLDC